MAEQKKSYLEEWGERFHDGISYALHLNCPCCGDFEVFETSENMMTVVKYAIGFSKDGPVSDKQNTWVIIYQCPHCLTKFWHHIDEPRLKFYSRSAHWRKPQPD